MILLRAFRNKEERLNNWLNKLTETERAEYNAGMRDERRSFLRKKYKY